MMREWVHCYDEAANHQVPIAVAFWIIWIVSAQECSSLMQNLMQICCSIRSVILSVMDTHYMCLFSSIYHHHWLVQRSRQCSCMCIPSSPLSLAAMLHHRCHANHSHYINSGWSFSGQTLYTWWRLGTTPLNDYKLWDWEFFTIGKNPHTWNWSL